MTQPSRTTETINRDNAAIRDIMHQIRELTVPDRATLALGLIGHLATMMNRSQMAKLMGQLQEEAARVQDVPPSRQHADDSATDQQASATRAAEDGGAAGAGRHAREDSRAAADRRPTEARKHHGDVLEDQVREGPAARAAGGASRQEQDESRHGVGQAGRGAFRSGRLL